MRLLRLALENRRWDLAAHTIIFATATVLKNKERPHARKRKQEKGRPTGKPER